MRAEWRSEGSRACVVKGVRHAGEVNFFLGGGGGRGGVNHEEQSSPNKSMSQQILSITYLNTRKAQSTKSQKAQKDFYITVTQAQIKHYYRLHRAR